jgi:hypothetical protein
MIERTAFLFDTPNYHKYTWTSTEQNDSTSNGLDGYNQEWGKEGEPGEEPRYHGLCIQMQRTKERRLD